MKQRAPYVQRAPWTLISRFTFHGTRQAARLLSAKHLDWFISLGLLLAGLAAYTYTLAPTLLSGDVALFQYTPQVLGVTYPTGFPSYLLAAKLWLTLFPFGEVAWRMNLFSALCAGLALPILYHVAQRIWRNRLAALTAVLIFATLPTYWRWATAARVYTFNILLFAIVLWLVARGAPPYGEYDAGGIGRGLLAAHFWAGSGLNSK